MFGAKHTIVIIIIITATLCVYKYLYTYYVHISCTHTTVQEICEWDHYLNRGGRAICRLQIIITVDIVDERYYDLYYIVFQY